MEHSVIDRVPERVQPACGFLSLPPELRNRIYDEMIPCRIPDTILRARYGGLRFLSASRQMFLDVAPAFYSGSFSVNTRLSSGSLASDFRHHLLKTYGEEQLSWIWYYARHMVTRIIVDVAVPPYCTPGMAAERFSTYFHATRERFPNLSTLQIRVFVDQDSARDVVPKHQKSAAHWSTFHPLFAQPTFQHALDILRQPVPVECSVEITNDGKPTQAEPRSSVRQFGLNALPTYLETLATFRTSS
ncbi:hypothetical protein LTR37_014636 [Vermiconidia calcicola]|uniref:Uncharacterized protein n=1 Tax=Vermiconidia calcicola TaxID=1690605 RepID=A0ACC3MT25_9PEZI|nr:hypothetical protein LTR37_014636 [Vermiconidia calcicola]